MKKLIVFEEEEFNDFRHQLRDCMKKLIVFEEEEFNDFRRQLIEAIIENSKQGYGVRFISRDRDAGGEELNDMAMRVHLVCCLEKVWPK